jgi:hypothetical protein
MTNTIQEKLDEILKDLPPYKHGELYDELYDFMCKSIIVPLKDSIAEPGISQEEINRARSFAELNPDAEAAKELLEFLDSEDVMKAFVVG